MLKPLLLLLPLARAGFRLTGYDDDDCSPMKLSWADAEITGLENPYEAAGAQCVDFQIDGKARSMYIDSTSCESGGGITADTYKDHGCGEFIENIYDANGECKTHYSGTYFWFLFIPIGASEDWSIRLECIDDCEADGAYCREPTPRPTPLPTNPTPGPSPEPSYVPSRAPTPEPTPGPSPRPSPAPTRSDEPTPAPSTLQPTSSKKSGGAGPPVTAGTGITIAVAVVLVIAGVACGLAMKGRGKGQLADDGPILAEAVLVDDAGVEETKDDGMVDVPLDMDVEASDAAIKDAARGAGTYIGGDAYRPAPRRRNSREEPVLKGIYANPAPSGPVDAGPVAPATAADVRSLKVVAAEPKRRSSFAAPEPATTSERARRASFAAVSSTVSAFQAGAVRARRATETGLQAVSEALQAQAAPREAPEGYELQRRGVVEVDEEEGEETWM